MELEELIEKGIKEAGIGSFKGLGSLEVFKQVKKAIGYLSGKLEELGDSPDFPEKLKQVEELNETLYSASQILYDTYCGHRFLSTSKTLFERIGQYISTIDGLTHHKYNPQLNLNLSFLEGTHKKRIKNINIFKIGGDRFKLR
jgi:hypothetical protein